MRKVAILTDTTADLSEMIRKEREIFSIPLYVSINGTQYKDQFELDTKSMYDLVEKTKTMPKTMAPSPGDFQTLFEELLKTHENVFYVGIGAKLSATIKSALLAAENFSNRVFIIDSANLSSGIALLVLNACDLRDQGLKGFEIKQKIDSLTKHVHSQFVINQLDYLYKGGRLSALSALFGGILRVKPVIRVVEGAMEVYKKPIGVLKKGVDIILKDYFDRIDKVDLKYTMVTHSLSEEMAKYMIEEIKRKVPNTTIIESSAGCVISSHCGKGTIGVLYITKDE